jgi:hypothetical protein
MADPARTDGARGLGEPLLKVGVGIRRWSAEAHDPCDHAVTAAVTACDLGHGAGVERCGVREQHQRPWCGAAEVVETERLVYAAHVTGLDQSRGLAGSVAGRHAERGHPDEPGLTGVRLFEHAETVRRGRQGGLIVTAGKELRGPGLGDREDVVALRVESAGTGWHPAG